MNDEELNELTHAVSALIGDAADIELTLDDKYRVNDVLESLILEFTA